MREFFLENDHLAAMEAHVRACLPEEACGMLGGLSNWVEAVIPITNRAHSPVRYEMDPVEMVKAFHWLDERGIELIATYHSHPSGPDRPSETDLAEFRYPGTAMLIWYPVAAERWAVRAFWIEGQKVREIQIGRRPVP